MSITTNLHLGEYLLKDTGDWAFLTTLPKLSKAENQHICPILFDVENKKIIIDKKNIIVYNKNIANEVTFRYINPEKWGRRGKKFALTTEPRKFKMLSETLFGKKNKDKGSGQKSLEEYNYNSSELYKALSLINDNFEKSDLDLKGIMDKLNFGKNEQVILFYATIKHSEIRSGEVTALFNLEGFEKFVFEKFGPKKGNNGLDYLTGLRSDGVDQASFERGHNLNAIFQTTSTNYASNFSNFSKNYKTNPRNALALDKASKYYLNNLSTEIAGVNHLIIPNYRYTDLKEISWDEKSEYLKKTSDLLFQYIPINEKFRKENQNLFWISYVAYESDGNSFKIISEIRDVNNKWLEEIINVFTITGVKFRQYISSINRFNLKTVYGIIPVRKKDKSKINPALLLFKDILKQRKIKKERLFFHFKELILCHYYERYRQYNIAKQSSFDFAAKDSVIRYQLLFKSLQNLKLLDMETNKIKYDKPKSKSQLQDAIEKFFDEMEYTPQQKALFYLGRVISQVGEAQYKSKHKSKPILKKINFNGMDADALLRLSNDLAGKAIQYTIHNYTDWNLSRFNKIFKKEKWTLKNDENIFYLMAGYTFGLTQQNSNKS